MNWLLNTLSISFKIPLRILRSADSNLLIPKTRLCSVGDLIFFSARLCDYGIFSLPQPISECGSVTLFF